MELFYHGWGCLAMWGKVDGYQKVATDALRYDNEDSELNLYAILAVGLQGNTALVRKYFDEAKRHLSEEHRMVLREHLGLA